MRVLYFDCFSGASGDMVVGALIDAGVPFDQIQAAVGSLAIDPDTIWVERVNRAGIRATKFCVRGEIDANVTRAGELVAHAHDSGNNVGVHQRHRTLAEVDCLIEESGLSASERARAKSLFARLGEVEGGIHDTPPSDVHLHEVGALDSVVDIVAAVRGIEVLAAVRVVASPMNVGSGTVQTAHGLYPVPAPATLQLLKGVPVYAGPQGVEMVTPTGALLVTSYATHFGPLPKMRVETIGYGAGARDLPGMPNVLRLIIGEVDDATEAAEDVQDVVVIEAEIDDMNPQMFGAVMETLLIDGALDVYFTPIQMKKNRPGTLISVIALPEARQRLTARIFRETTTIGLRYREMLRECLTRALESVATPFGPVRIKVARRRGEVLNAAPEFDDCVRLASEQGRPVKEVHAAAMKAWLDTERQ